MNGALKILIIVLVAGALVGGGSYFVLDKSAKGQSEPLLSSEVTGKAVTIPQGNTTTDQTIQSVLRQINDLDQIKLDTTIFAKPEFLALKDISQELPAPSDIGRPNPFAPIGVDIGTVPGDETAVDLTNDLPGADLTMQAVITNEVQNIGQRSATLSANVTVTTQTSRWFEYGTNQNTVNKTTKQTGTESTFTATVTTLSPKTTYYVKAAVDQNGTVSYGDLVSFKTAE